VSSVRLYRSRTIRDIPKIDPRITPRLSGATNDACSGHKAWPYEIGAALGAGGMGEVYRARIAEGMFQSFLAMDSIPIPDAEIYIIRTNPARLGAGNRRRRREFYR